MTKARCYTRYYVGDTPREVSRDWAANEIRKHRKEVRDSSFYSLWMDNDHGYKDYMLEAFGDAWYIMVGWKANTLKEKS